MARARTRGVARGEGALGITDARRGLALATALAAATALGAQMAVYLPWNSQVPVTLQTHAVVLSGLLLGPRWALVSQAEYLAAGLLGAPVFAGLRAGPAVLFGPTGGYLVGFLASAWLAGLLAPSRASLRRRLVAAGAAIVVPYVFGVAWLYAAWRTGGTGEAALLSAVSLGVAPFLGVDLVKAAAAALVAQKAEA